MSLFHKLIHGNETDNLPKITQKNLHKIISSHQFIDLEQLFGLNIPNQRLLKDLYNEQFLKKFVQETWFLKFNKQFLVSYKNWIPQKTNYKAYPTLGCLRSGGCFPKKFYEFYKQQIKKGNSHSPNLLAQPILNLLLFQKQTKTVFSQQINALKENNALTQNEKNYFKQYRTLETIEILSRSGLNRLNLQRFYLLNNLSHFLKLVTTNYQSYFSQFLATLQYDKTKNKYRQRSDSKIECHLKYLEYLLLVSQRILLLYLDILQEIPKFSLKKYHGYIIKPILETLTIIVLNVSSIPQNLTILIMEKEIFKILDLLRNKIKFSYFEKINLVQNLSQYFIPPIVQHISHNGEVEKKNVDINNKDNENNIDNESIQINQFYKNKKAKFQKLINLNFLQRYEKLQIKKITQEKEYFNSRINIISFFFQLSLKNQHRKFDQFLFDSRNLERLSNFILWVSFNFRIETFKMKKNPKIKVLNLLELQEKETLKLEKSIMGEERTKNDNDQKEEKNEKNTRRKEIKINKENKNILVITKRKETEGGKSENVTIPESEIERNKNEKTNDQKNDQNDQKEENNEKKEKKNIKNEKKNDHKIQLPEFVNDYLIKQKKQLQFFNIIPKNQQKYSYNRPLLNKLFLLLNKICLNNYSQETSNFKWKILSTILNIYNINEQKTKQMNSNELMVYLYLKKYCPILQIYCLILLNQVINDNDIEFLRKKDIWKILFSNFFIYDLIDYSNESDNSGAIDKLKLKKKSKVQFQLFQLTKKYLFEFFVNICLKDYELNEFDSSSKEIEELLNFFYYCLKLKNLQLINDCLEIFLILLNKNAIIVKKIIFKQSNSIIIFTKILKWLININFGFKKLNTKNFSLQLFYKSYYNLLNLIHQLINNEKHIPINFLIEKNLLDSLLLLLFENKTKDWAINIFIKFFTGEINFYESLELCFFKYSYLIKQIIFINFHNEDENDNFIVNNNKINILIQNNKTKNIELMKSLLNGIKTGIKIKKKYIQHFFGEKTNFKLIKIFFSSKQLIKNFYNEILKLLKYLLLNNKKNLIIFSKMSFFNQIPKIFLNNNFEPNKIFKIFLDLIINNGNFNLKNNNQLLGSEFILIFFNYCFSYPNNYQLLLRLILIFQKICKFSQYNCQICSKNNLISYLCEIIFKINNNVHNNIYYDNVNKNTTNMSGNDNDDTGNDSDNNNDNDNDNGNDNGNDINDEDDNDDDDDDDDKNNNKNNKNNKNDDNDNNNNNKTKKSKNNKNNHDHKYTTIKEIFKLVEIISYNCIRIFELNSIFKLFFKIQNDLKKNSNLIIHFLNLFKNYFLLDFSKSLILKPENYFLFSGLKSKIDLPVIHKWPKNGFSFVTWIYFDSFEEKNIYKVNNDNSIFNTTKKYKPVIFNFFNENNQGIKSYVKSNGKFLIIQTNSFNFSNINTNFNNHDTQDQNTKQNHHHVNSIKSNITNNNNNNLIKDKAKFEINISLKKWYFLVITHKTNWATRKNIIKCYLNNILINKSDLKPINQNIPLKFNQIGSNSKLLFNNMKNKKKNYNYNNNNCFSGKMCSIYFFNRSIKKQFIKNIYKLANLIENVDNDISNNGNYNNNNNNNTNINKYNVFNKKLQKKIIFIFKNTTINQSFFPILWKILNNKYKKNLQRIWVLNIFIEILQKKHLIFNLKILIELFVFLKSNEKNKTIFLNSIKWHQKLINALNFDQLNNDNESGEDLLQNEGNGNEKDKHNENEIEKQDGDENRKNKDNGYKNKNKNGNGNENKNENENGNKNKNKNKNKNENENGNGKKNENQNRNGNKNKNENGNGNENENENENENKNNNENKNKKKNPKEKEIEIEIEKEKEKEKGLNNNKIDAQKENENQEKEKEKEIDKNDVLIKRQINKQILLIIQELLINDFEVRLIPFKQYKFLFYSIYYANFNGKFSRSSLINLILTNFLKFILNYLKHFNQIDIIETFKNDSIFSKNIFNLIKFIYYFLFQIPKANTTILKNDQEFESKIRLSNIEKKWVDYGIVVQLMELLERIGIFKTNLKFPVNNSVDVFKFYQYLIIFLNYYFQYTDYKNCFQLIRYLNLLIIKIRKHNHNNDKNKFSIKQNNYLLLLILSIYLKILQPLLKNYKNLSFKLKEGKKIELIFQSFQKAIHDCEREFNHIFFNYQLKMNIKKTNFIQIKKSMEIEKSNLIELILIFQKYHWLQLFDLILKYGNKKIQKKILISTKKLNKQKIKILKMIITNGNTVLNNRNNTNNKRKKGKKNNDCKLLINKLIQEKYLYNYNYKNLMKKWNKIIKSLIVMERIYIPEHLKKEEKIKWKLNNLIDFENKRNIFKRNWNFLNEKNNKNFFNHLKVTQNGNGNNFIKKKKLKLKMNSAKTKNENRQKIIIKKENNYNQKIKSYEEIKTKESGTEKISEMGKNISEQKIKLSLIKLKKKHINNKEIENVPRKNQQNKNSLYLKNKLNLIHNYSDLIKYYTFYQNEKKNELSHIKKEEKKLIKKVEPEELKFDILQNDQKYFNQNNIFKCSLIRINKNIRGFFKLTKTNIQFFKIKKFSNSLINNIDDKDLNLNLNLNLSKNKNFNNWYYNWKIIKIDDIYKRNYQGERTAIEIYLKDNSTYFFNFEKNKRNSVYANIKKNANLINPSKDWNLNKKIKEKLKFWKDKWKYREITNFQYLMKLNIFAGRTYHDLNQYPIFPWVLSNYESEELDLNDPKNFRDLSKPIGELNPERFITFQRRFEKIKNENNSKLPPYHYETHYSTTFIVLDYLFLIDPFTTIAIKKYNIETPRFRSVDKIWKSCQNSLYDVRELIPEFYYMPEFLQNKNNIKIKNKLLKGIELPPWAKKSVYKFIRIHRHALESGYVSQHLNEWIDLIFGFKQNGIEAEKANNLFFYESYEQNLKIQIKMQYINKRKMGNGKMINTGNGKMINNGNGNGKGKELGREIEKVTGSQTERERVGRLGSGIKETNNEFNILTFGKIPTQLFYKKRHCSKYSLKKAQKRNKIKFHKFLNWDPVFYNILQAIPFPITKYPLIYLTGNSSDNMNKKNTNINQIITFDLERNLCLNYFSTNLSISNNMGFHLENDQFLGARKKIGSQFDKEIQNLSNCFTYMEINYHKYFISCGYKDNSIKINNADNSKLIHTLFDHNDVVTCISSYQNYFLTGSKDTTLRLWKININGNELPKRPKMVMRGHNTEIVCVHYCPLMNLILSADKNGIVMLRSSTNGETLKAFSINNIICKEDSQVDNNSNDHYSDSITENENTLSTRSITLLHIVKLGYLLFYCEPNFYIFSLNGDFISHIQINGLVTCFDFPQEHNYFICGTKKSMVYIISIPQLKIVQEYTIYESIYSLKLLSNYKHVFIGTKSGKLLLGNFVKKNLKK
ncbi:beige/beach-related [Anaeramoeba flamelloides]|uniref:Beige/beach-related n=1 Tax=Anaeramoeba flamelloides TaxID=1746091 RepID=A0ABQ8XLK6_9EUKA|nr:beige/beach-related [Anaeramoeba flamelloides]